MIATIDLRGKQLTRAELLKIIPRTSTDLTPVLEAAHEIIFDVKNRGEVAIRAQAEKFDHVSGHHIRVPQSELDQALSNLDPVLKSALEVTIERVRTSSKAQVPPPVVTEIQKGATISQRWQPVDRAGTYVPGGKAVYPSSVIMNIVPAQIAGVKSIALVSPPQVDKGGSIHPTIMATAAMLGISEVYAIGGAGAIAALAYGVPEIGLEPVNVITGPGNAFVSAAKGIVRSHVGIDSEAGPTEILIIADHTAHPKYVAADLISQAEHDELASSVLVTTSEDLLEEVKLLLETYSSETLHSERVKTSISGNQSALVLVDNVQAAIDFSNAYAPEHLEIHTQNASEDARLCTNAGAIFVGDYSPVSLGDYSAGSNHVLPTVGHAMFSSALGAYTFLRAQQIITYDKNSLAAVAEGIRALAEDENLPAHAEAVDIRFEKEEN